MKILNLYSGLGGNRKQLDITKYKITNKRQILRNCVEPELGLHIFNSIFNSKQERLL